MEDGMKGIQKILTLIMVVILLIMAVPSPVLANQTPFETLPDEVITFPDANLEAVIREAISKPTGDIYQSDLEALTELRAGLLV